MTTLSPHLVSCRPPDLIFLGNRGKLGRAAGTGGPPSVWGPTQQLRVQQRGGKPSLPAKKKSVSREACTQLSGTLPVWGTHLSTENNPVTCSRRSVDGYTAAALQTEWHATDRRPSLSVRASRETRKGPGHRSWGSREEPVLPWGTSTGTPRLSDGDHGGSRHRLRSDSAPPPTAPTSQLLCRRHPNFQKNPTGKVFSPTTGSKT